MCSAFSDLHWPIGVESRSVWCGKGGRGKSPGVWLWLRPKKQRVFDANFRSIVKHLAVLNFLVFEEKVNSWLLLTSWCFRAGNLHFDLMGLFE
jgi:hypothetical protein